MKTKLIVLIFISCLMLISFVYFASEYHDFECLKEKAKDYCQNKDMSFSGIYLSNEFECLDDRTPGKFKFLDEELDECIKKKAFSLEGLK